jgi:protein-disulfide isomerase
MGDHIEAKVFVVYLLGTVAALSVGLNIFLVRKIRQPRPLNTARFETVRQPALDATDHIRGNAAGVPVVIEYSDFQCSFCREMHATLKSLTEGGQIVWVFRSFPLTNIHPVAMDAAVAAECASQQGKFWQYADALFEKQEQLKPNVFGDVAASTGLELEKFKNCQLSSGVAAVQAQIAAANSLGIDSTPTLFINSKRVAGAIPKEVILSMVGR